MISEKEYLNNIIEMPGTVIALTEKEIICLDENSYENNLYYITVDDPRAFDIGSTEDLNNAFPVEKAPNEIKERIYKILNTEVDWKKTQTQLYESMKEMVKSNIAAYRTDPDSLLDFLKFKSKFCDYSLNNSVLIQNQNENSIYLANYDFWGKEGYSVGKGQKAMKILYPVKRKVLETTDSKGNKRHKNVNSATRQETEFIKSGKIEIKPYTTFAYKNVFDISQTDCPKENYYKYNPVYSKSHHEKLFTAVKRYTETLGYKDISTVFENNNKSATENLINSVQELNNKITKDISNKDTAPEIIDFEKDCSAILLQNYFGIGATESVKEKFFKDFKYRRQFKACKFIV